MLHKNLFYVVWFIIVAAILIRFIQTKPPEITQNQFIQAEGEIATFPSVKSDKQILKLVISKVTTDSDIQSGNTVQIITTLYRTYNRGDKIRIEGKINKSYYIYYPKINYLSAQQNIFVKYLDDFRNALEKNIQKHLPEPHATLAMGMLLGTNRALPTQIDKELKTTSTTHMIVVSGFNITLVTILVMKLAGFLHRKIAITISIIATIIFVILAGANPPAVRAGIMATLSLVGQLLGKQVETLYILLLAAAGMLLYDPQLILSLSFQLSVMATLGVLLLPEKIEDAVQKLSQKILQKLRKQKEQVIITKQGEPSATQTVIKYFYSELTTTLGAQIAVVPLLTKTFGTLSLIGPLANIAVAWTVPFIMITALLVGLSGFLNEQLAEVLSFLTLLFTAFFLQITHLFSSLPNANLENVKIGWIGVGVYYSILGVIIGKITEHKK